MVEATQYQSKIAFNEDVSFAASATSDAQDLSGCTLCGAYIPSGFAGTSITFESSTASNGTFFPVIDGEGSTLSYIVAAGNYLALEPARFAGIRFIKLVSNVSETASITLALRAV